MPVGEAITTIQALTFQPLTAVTTARPTATLLVPLGEAITTVQPQAVQPPTAVTVGLPMPASILVSAQHFM